MHTEYVPAIAPVSTIVSVMSVEEVYTEFTLVTALVGVPAHKVEDMTNADTSPDTSTNPAPLTSTD